MRARSAPPSEDPTATIEGAESGAGEELALIGLREFLPTLPKVRTYSLESERGRNRERKRERQIPNTWRS